jgi:hypothetical protein
MDRGVFFSRTRAMRARTLSGGHAGATARPADADVFHGALLVVAATAGLVWALSHDVSDAARDERGPRPSPFTPGRSR